LIERVKVPRIARGLADKQTYHIINRGNRRESVFHDKDDYEKFMELLSIAKERYSIKIYAYCLMPNHFHLVIFTPKASALSQAMQWIGTSYVRYYNKRYQISGHLWQGRYKSFIVQEDSYLLSLIKYVEANPLRAKIVKDATLYKYSSAYNRVNRIEDIMDTPPIELPNEWAEYINQKDTKTDLDTIRNSVNRQAPLGEEDWQMRVAQEYGLESTLNPRGRPLKREE
jgi:putative transposase